MTTGGPFGLSSSGVNPRPRIGSTPKTFGKSWVISAPGTRSALPPSEMV
jgi:hypothetical protein